MTATEIATQIRTRLKSEMGLTGKQVSVKAKSFSMGQSVDIFVKAITDFRKIEGIAYEFQHIRRDEVTGEVLSGGNTYISVEPDWDFRSALSLSLMEVSSAIWGKLAEDGDMVEHGGFELVRSRDAVRIYKGDELICTCDVSPGRIADALARAMIVGVPSR